MRYYKVKSNFDNVARLKWCGRHLTHDGVYVGRELFTEKEIEKELTTHLLPAPVEKMFDIIEIPKSKIYWFFGARFQSEGR